MIQRFSYCQRAGHKIKNKLNLIQFNRSVLTQEKYKRRILHFINPLVLSFGKYRRLYQKRLDSEISELNYWTGLNSTSNFTIFKEHKGQNNLEPEQVWGFIRERVGNVEVLVDLGSGVRPSNICTPKIHINVEKWHPYNSHLSNRYPNSNLIQVEMDALEFLKIQPAASLDTIIAFDLIEHLTKDLGWKLIEEIQRTTKNTAVIFTPNGFMEQHVSENDSDDWGWTGNILQNHLSGWTDKDFLNWNCRISPNYHAIHGFEGGALVAVYQPQKNLFENSGTVVLLNLSEDLPVGQWQYLSDRILQAASCSEISIVFHNSFAQGSHLILPNFQFPNWPAKYASFDPFINEVESALHWLVKSKQTDVLSILRSNKFKEIIYVSKVESESTNQYFRKKLVGKNLKEIIF